VGSLILPTSGAVYLDANCFIYSIEKVGPYFSLLQPAWQAAKRGQFLIVTSELTWMEVLVRPLKDGNSQVENSFRSVLTAGDVQMIPATLSLWEDAAKMRVLGLKTPDALHAATARAAQAALFVTNDATFRHVPGLNVAVLHEQVP